MYEYQTCAVDGTGEVATGRSGASSHSIGTEFENIMEDSAAMESWTMSLAYLPKFDSIQVESSSSKTHPLDEI